MVLADCGHSLRMRACGSHEPKQTFNLKQEKANRHMPLEQQTIRTLRVRVYQNWIETRQKSVVFVVELSLYETATSKKNDFP